MSVSETMKRVRIAGGAWPADGEEGPRLRGHCAYCAGPCEGVTGDCEVRVFNDSQELRGDASEAH
jgi:hypothetical protein